MRTWRLADGLHSQLVLSFGFFALHGAWCVLRGFALLPVSGRVGKEGGIPPSRWTTE